MEAGAAAAGQPARGTTPAHGAGFRPDLEGLRGVAILLVLVFHAGLPGTGGGFVGVDVFFVLSGFLITGLLVREREQTSRIDLPAFYARRARRILPAAAVVLVGVLAASWVMLPPLDLGRTAGDVAASALSVSNIRFALQATDYFAADAAPSPVLHYWSLSAEEQFYLLWPALLVLATRGSRPRLGAGIVLGLVAAVSLAAAIAGTDSAPAWAFFSLPSRAWQLALGGLLAVTAPWHRRLPDALLAPVGWLGLGAILAAVVLIDPGTPYPGTAALLPTLGAAAVVLAGARRWSTGVLLERSVTRFFGRISYSLYLVHWPILVLPAAGLALGEELPLEARVGLVGLSIVVAIACQRWVEEPFHRGRRFSLPARRTLSLAGTAIAATVILAAGVAVGAEGRIGPGGPDGGVAVVDPSPSPDDRPSADPSPAPLASGRPGTSPAASPGPTASSGAPASAEPSPSPSPSPSPRPPVGPIALPADVRPALGRARADMEPLLHDGCLLGATATKLRDCVYGDPEGTTTIALVGDSHAAQWFPALERIAIDRGWRLVALTKVSCRFVDLPQISRELKREYTECYAWRRSVIARLKELNPALTVVSVTRGMEPTIDADNDPTRQGTAMGPMFDGVPGRLAIIVDTPQSRYDVPACISSHVDDVRACQTPRGEAFNWRYLKLERAAAKATGGTIVDLSDDICPYDSCPVLLDGMIIYRDSHHLTATFAASLAGPLESALPAL
jgi:peptidoglycan/LPS O-acetylase OafA/YrhL